MIKRMQLFPLNFYKKEKFNGSDGKMCFRLAKTEFSEGEEKRIVLRGTIWKGPFCYDKTPQDQMERKDFSFSEEGICEAMDWINIKSAEYNK